MKGKQSDKKDVSRKSCGECRFYDWTTEREFHRKVGSEDEKTGERSLIIEPRAVCRGPKARAKGHLVHRDQTKRPCEQWEAGKYEPPKEEEKKPIKEDTDEEKTAPDEYHGKPKELKQLEELIEKSKTSVEKNRLNGEKKTLTVKRGKVTVK